MYCLFDFDGTLFDTSEGIIASSKYALDSMGIPYDSDRELSAFIGPPLMDTFIKQYNLDQETATIATKLFREYYGREGVYRCSPYPGMKETLSALRENGISTFVATSKPTVFTLAILKRFHMLDCFNDIVGSNLDNSRSKKAEIISYILEKNGIGDLQDVYMIGDKKQDMIGAQMAGTRFIGVLYGFGTRDEFQDSVFVCETVEILRQTILTLFQHSREQS